MPRRSQFGGAGLPYMGPITKGMLALYVGGAIIAKLTSLAELTALQAGQVWHGEVWRLVTYPWLAGDVLSLIINVLMVVFFVSPLESMWGQRRLLWRIGAFVILPAVIVTLLALTSRTLRYHTVFGGLDALMYGLIAAFASERRGEKFYFFPLPIELSGDGLIAIDAAILGLAIVFNFPEQGVAPYLVSILSFAMALVWFRFNVVRELRRDWLRFRKRRLEGRMSRLRAKRNLHVISSDDDDDQPRRFLH